jgi:hypothetical protein
MVMAVGLKAYYNFYYMLKILLLLIKQIFNIVKFN